MDSIQIRGGTSTWVTSNNILLLQREMFIEYNNAGTSIVGIKIGDGSLLYNSLPYFTPGKGDHNKGVFASLSSLQTAYPTATAGDLAFVDAGVGNDPFEYVWDVSDSAWVQIGSSGGGGGSNFISDIVVSLSGGKTLGKFTNGQTIPASGKTAEQVLNLIAIESIYPTYAIPTLTIAQSGAAVGEVGEALSNVVTATFTKNDAGNLSAIKIQKNGSDLTPNGTTSPFSKTDSAVRILGNVQYQAFANYAAGALKNITPSNTPDDRTAAVRNPNAPLASETNFASSLLNLTGLYKIFFGDSSSAPTTSANVRALPSNRFTNAGNTFALNTGTTNKIFSVAMPATNSLVSVFDVTASNTDITSQYTLSTFNVNDAGGNAVSYKVYTMTQAVAYSINHVHNITIS